MSSALVAFPFDHVIITFPDVRVAEAAAAGPLRQWQATSAYATTTKFTATADPYGARVGSGGGTAAALLLAQRDSNQNADSTTNTSTTPHSLSETVLILHAGGAASRCPTQMCLGKAWTSLPTTAAVVASTTALMTTDTATTKNTATTDIQTPLHLWLQMCARLFQGIPQGTCIVIASDTLLQLDTAWHDDDENNDNDAFSVDWQAELATTSTVLGLAVPAPLPTAKNHGVFVVGAAAVATSKTKKMQILPCTQVLQKPSVEILKTFSFVVANEDSERDEPNNKDCAWIDTGVTIFSPLAAMVFRQLAEEHLRRCTATGLKLLYEQRQQHSASDKVPLTLSDFAAATALSVDLYTHILQALSLTKDSNGNSLQEEDKKKAYLKKYGSVLGSVETATAIWDCLSPSTLQVLAVPTGRFWHLGTTRELRDFLVQATRDDDNDDVLEQANTTTRQPQQQQQQWCRNFGKSLGLTRRVQAYTVLGALAPGPKHRNDQCNLTSDDDDCGAVDSTAVIYHSLLIELHKDRSTTTFNETVLRHQLNKGTSSIGSGTVVEYCCVEAMNENIMIGKNCLISGLRSPPCPQPPNQSGIHIPDSMIVQMVQLSSKSSSPPFVVVLALGMDDDIKKRDTVYGCPLDAFFRWAGLEDRDVWDEPQQPTSLWTAKIHPVICLNQNDTFASVFSWLQKVPFINAADSDGTLALGDDASFVKWKTCRRLSLSEIGDLSDAPGEFAYREDLKIKFRTFKVDFDKELQTMLHERQHTRHLDFQFLVDEYAANVYATIDSGKQAAVVREIIDTLHGLDKVFSAYINQRGGQDISARACMVMSGFLDDLASALPSSKLDTVDHQDRVSGCLSSILASLYNTEHMPDGGKEVEGALNDFTALTSLRDECVVQGQAKSILFFSNALDEVAGILTGKHVLAARGMSDALGTEQPIFDNWILATAPARVDLSGGWSDTPPICYEFGSLVTGMAVLIDGRKPLACRCRIVSGGTGILLRTESRNSETGELISAIETELADSVALQDYRDPTSDCALLKCTLVHLGLVPERSAGCMSEDFQSKINLFCRSKGHVRLELVATTLLPQGSGLGTSSILAGCILAAVGKCIGALRPSRAEYIKDIIDSVLNVEQYLTTGGGFQDQVNGLIGGIKAVASRANAHPMRLTIEQLAIDPECRRKLDNSFVLVFTGKTRLAKNLLKRVLQRWAKQTPEIVRTVTDLVKGAEICREAVISGDLDTLGDCLTKYWAQKKIMAGPSSGVEPEVVRDVISEFLTRRLIRAASLCGAGGGGFMVLLCADDISCSDLQYALTATNDTSAATADFTWHNCKLCDEGLVIKQLGTNVGNAADFDMSWLSTGT